jgi:hypothetical protein
MARFQKPTERERAWLGVLPAGAIYFGLQNVVQEERAFFVAMTIFVFYAIISVDWDKRREARFWGVLSTFAIAHIIALSLFKIPHLKGSSLAVALPFMFIDGFVMWGVMNFIEKRFPRPAQ